jgi:putative ABC transport system substrate-binding protein
MRRREFLGALGGAAAGWPLAGRAQQKLPVIGILGLTPERFSRNPTAILNGLAAIGYVEGRDFLIEYRWADFDPDRRAANAIDLVQHGVAIILVFSLPGALAAKTVTQSVPIIFSLGADPVAGGLVASLNRPGGNLTGVTVRNVDVIGKRLEILHQLAPAAISIAFFVNPENKNYAEGETREMQVAARARGVRLLVVNVNSPNEIEGAFATLLREHAGALVVGGDSIFVNSRDQLTALAAHNAVPAIYQSREYVTAGGLASYGTRYDDNGPIVADYLVRVLKGGKPADLPVHQLAKTELVINLKAAKALSLDIPPTLLATADEVIE